MFLRVELGENVLLSETTRMLLTQLGAEAELGEVKVEVPCNPAIPTTLANIAQHPLLGESFLKGID